jgi:metal-responsive CopG/Arc/MetJ family transcriptional regulator
MDNEPYVPNMSVNQTFRKAVRDYIEEKRKFYNENEATVQMAFANNLAIVIEEVFADTQDEDWAGIHMILRAIGSVASDRSLEEM